MNAKISHLLKPIFLLAAGCYYSPTPKARGRESRSRAGERHLPVPDEMPETKSRGLGGRRLGTGTWGPFQGLLCPAAAARGAPWTRGGRHAPARPRKDAPDGEAWRKGELKGKKSGARRSQSDLVGLGKTLPRPRVPPVLASSLQDAVSVPAGAGEAEDPPFLPAGFVYCSYLWVLPQKIQFPRAGNCSRHLKINRAARAGDRRSKSDVSRRVIQRRAR